MFNGIKLSLFSSFSLSSFFKFSPFPVLLAALLDAFIEITVKTMKTHSKTRERSLSQISEQLAQHDSVLSKLESLRTIVEMLEKSMASQLTVIPDMIVKLATC